MYSNTELSVRFETDVKHRSLYKWCIQEIDNSGKQVGEDQIPWAWRQYFTAKSIRLIEGFDDDHDVPLFDDEEAKDESSSLKLKTNNTIIANLQSGRYDAETGLIEDTCSYSFFGTSRRIKDIRLVVSEVHDGASETCYSEGILSHDYESDFRQHTVNDLLCIRVKLNHDRFSSIVESIKTGNVDWLNLNINRVSGFYSQWSPSITAWNIKVMPSLMSDIKIENADEPEEKIIQRLDYVKHFSLSLGKNVVLLSKKIKYKAKSERVTLNDDDDVNIRIESAISAEQAIFLGEKQSNLERFEIAKELIPLCIEEAIRLGDSGKELEDRFELIGDILTTIADASENRSYLYENVRPKEEITRQGYRSIWTRKNPQIAFNEGTESESYFDNILEVREMAANYLQNPYLQSPTLDWVILDILATGELCQFGEAVKKTPLGHKSDEYNMHYRYYEMNGNLLKMNKFDWGAFSKTVLTKIGILVLPIFLIIALFEIEWNIAAYITASLYGISMACYFIFKTFRGAKLIFRFLTGQPNPLYKQLYLWEKMYEVWRSMEGDIVSPKNIRKAMEESAGDGAVWDQAMWGIVDRAIASNPVGIIINKNHLKYKKYN